MAPQGFPSMKEGSDSKEKKITVVISGISGLYPNSHNIKDLTKLLYEKVNPIISGPPRWSYKHPDVPQYLGKIPDVNRFDAQFFKVHYYLGMYMDTMSRLSLEQVYQAIYDAGLGPQHFNEKKVGVFFGTSHTESEKIMFYDLSSKYGLGLPGCSKSMFANRISYWLNIKGPSYNISDLCCSSTCALEQGYEAIVHGDCEAAIIVGANLCLLPETQINYGKVTKVCMDGKTKSFDQNADGFAHSESITVFLLQRSEQALRAYAEIVYVRNEYAILPTGKSGPKYGFNRNPEYFDRLYQDFYKKCKVSPLEVDYVEAFGSAEPEADKSELQAIGRTFCKGRSETLLVGSVMSNIGYTADTTGITAVTKVLLGYHHNKLAANLHCETPRQDVDALRDGRMRILTDHHPFHSTYAAINGMSLTGVNSHVLLRKCARPKDLNRYKCNLARLVVISGRQESSVTKVLDDLKSRPIDPEELALFYNIHQNRISGHLGRGYAILDTNPEGKTVCLREKTEFFDVGQRPLWFAYSGMGSQWPGMGTQFMSIPIFANAIERCHKILEPKGLDLKHIITSTDTNIFDDIMHSFVGIAAIQIGLTDVLYELGLVPDKIIGHSAGELGCAYADGCLTMEEIILASYYRGLVSKETPFIHGAMAAVGIGYKKLLNICPPEIDIACHNSFESSTISGPAVALHQFVEKLLADGVFAKEVACSDIAFHSRYVSDGGPALLKYLNEVIKTPKPRSERWVSTSIPQDKWSQPSSKYCSAEYYTNNLLKPVLFEETAQLIQPNAVVVEIAPHGLMQAIFKRSLPTCTNIALTRRGNANNIVLLLEAIGSLYMQGYHPKLQALYPKIEFPVSNGTPHLSHLVEWAHKETWSIPMYNSALKKKSSTCNFVISVHDQEHKYLQGHVIRGKVTYPFAAALVAVWDTLSMTLGVARKQLSVQFHDVHLYAEPLLHDQRQLQLTVSLQRGSGQFDIRDENTKVATGRITPVDKNIKEIDNAEEKPINTHLVSKDVYEILFEKDYSYRDDFRSIHSASLNFNEALLSWTNWVTLIDGLFQLNIMTRPYNGISQPIYIRELTIDTKKHGQLRETKIEKPTLIKANISTVYNTTRCGGICLRDIHFEDLPIRQEQFVLSHLQFVPFSQNSTTIRTKELLIVYIQIIAENVSKDNVNIVEVTYNEKSSNVEFIDNSIAGIKIDKFVVRRDDILSERNRLQSADIVLVQNLTTDDKILEVLYQTLPQNTFIINRDVYGQTNVTRERPSALYLVLCNHTNPQKTSGLQLIHWRPNRIIPSCSISVRNESDLAMLTSARASLPMNHRMLVVAPYPPPTNLKQLIRRWRSDTCRNQISLLMTNTIDEIFDNHAIDLAFKVYNNGVWGGEYFLPIEQKTVRDGRVTLSSSCIGDVDSLHWIEATDSREIGVPVTVHYASLSHYDAEKAAGLIKFQHSGQSSNNSYGMEFSGITERGNRVMGIMQSGAISSHLRANPELLWPVPDHWTLEDAATVPLAYCFALYCLAIKSNLQPKGNVLVHGGCGALGQAIISIALAHRCRVFTTVSDIHKKKFLLRLFPTLQETDIGNSRDESFEHMILKATDGEGCKVIINCGRDYLKNVSLKCCCKWGVTFDIEQIHRQDHFSYGMYNLQHDRSYITLDFLSIFSNQNLEDRKRLQQMVSEGITRGYVRPLSRAVYAPSDVTRACSLLAGSQHRGRVLLHMKIDESEPSRPTAIPKIGCSSNQSHLVLCDEDSFGLQFVETLINRGARTIHLHCNRPHSYLITRLRSWQEVGVRIKITSTKLYDAQHIEDLLSQTQLLDPLEGIHIIFTSTTKNNADVQLSNFIVKELDKKTRQKCRPLRYFSVMTNDSAIGAETCYDRVKNQLPATVLHLPIFTSAYGDGESRDTVSRRVAVEAAEQALSSQKLVTRVNLKRLQTSLLSQITQIADISISGPVDAHITLQDLGVKSFKLKAIRALLRYEYNVLFSEEDIATLSLRRLREIENTLLLKSFNKKHGLAAMFTHMDPDVSLATAESITLPTLNNNCISIYAEPDYNHAYLYMVPGLEGNYKRFSTLCQRLKLSALALQPGIDHPDETIFQTAQQYSQLILKRSSATNHFYLMGYEVGVFVALEVAAILEKHGLTGTIFCIGGGPGEIRAAIKDQLSELKTESSLQEALILHLDSLIEKNKKSDKGTLQRALSAATSWQEKMEIYKQLLRKSTTHSAEFIRAVIEAAYSRIVHTLAYKPQTYSLRSKIVILQSSSVCSYTESLKLSEQQIEVHRLQTPLSNVLDDIRCASIVNSYLKDHLLQAFDNMNLCEEYWEDATFKSI